MRNIRCSNDIARWQPIYLVPSLGAIQTVLDLETVVVGEMLVLHRFSLFLRRHFFDVRARLICYCGAVLKSG